MREEGRGELEGDARVGKRGPPRRQGALCRTPPRIKRGGKGGRCAPSGAPVRLVPTAPLRPAATREHHPNPPPRLPPPL